jgi:hypothetical protein
LIAARLKILTEVVREIQSGGQVQRDISVESQPFAYSVLGHR